MTADDLRAWQVHMGYTYAQAHAALGVSSATYARMLAGGKIDRRTGLACAALAAGLGEWAIEPLIGAKPERVPERNPERIQKP